MTIDLGQHRQYKLRTTHHMRDTATGHLNGLHNITTQIGIMQPLSHDFTCICYDPSYTITTAKGEPL